MIGMWRYVGKGKLQIFELLSITDDDDGPVFRLRHFDPRMVAREEKDKPLALRLVSRGRSARRSSRAPAQPTGHGDASPTAGRRRTSSRVTLDKDGTLAGVPLPSRRNERLP